MAANLANIRQGFKAALEAAIPDAQITGYLLENPTPPAFEIELGEDGVVYDLAMGRGLDQWTFTIRGLVASAVNVAAQRKLDDWLHSDTGTSVKGALEDNKTLPYLGAATVSDLWVVRASGPRAFSVIATPNVTYLGAEWVVSVLATGD